MTNSEIKNMNKKHTSLSKETMGSLIELGEILQVIHNRLRSKGRVAVEKGKAVFLEGNQKNNDTTSRI